MADNSQKEIPKQDMEQAVRYVYNNNEKTISVNGFLAGKVGHKIELAISTTSVANDTETYTFKDTTLIVSVIKVIYADGTREQFLSAERIG